MENLGKTNKKETLFASDVKTIRLPFTENSYLIESFSVLIANSDKSSLLFYCAVYAAKHKSQTSFVGEMLETNVKNAKLDFSTFI